MFCKFIDGCPFGLNMITEGAVDLGSKSFDGCLEVHHCEPGHTQVKVLGLTLTRAAYAWDEYGRQSPQFPVIDYHDAAEVAHNYLERLPRLRIVTFEDASKRTCVICKGLQLGRWTFQNIWFDQLRTEYGRKKIIKAYRELLPKDHLENMLKLARAGTLYELDE